VYDVAVLLLVDLITPADVPYTVVHLVEVLRLTTHDVVYVVVVLLLVDLLAPADVPYTVVHEVVVDCDVANTVVVD
jgi:hypothetical protein